MSRSAAAAWVDELHDILAGLRALRDMGQRAEDAVEAVLALPDIRRLRLTWELAVELADEDGRVGRQEMVRLLGPERVWLIEAAVFGRTRVLVCLDGGD